MNDSVWPKKGQAELLLEKLAKENTLQRLLDLYEANPTIRSQLNTILEAIGGLSLSVDFPTVFPNQHAQPLTNDQLRAQAVGVRDVYGGVEHTPDQDGADNVLEFTLSAGADFVIVDADNEDPADYTAYRCRATLDGTAPTETKGFVCRSGQATQLPFPSSSTVKVYAPSGVVVAVQAGRY